MCATLFLLLPFRVSAKKEQDDDDDIKRQKKRILCKGFPNPIRYIKILQENNWAITFSISVVTCTVASSATGKFVKMADDLMYSIKNTTHRELFRI